MIPRQSLRKIPIQNLSQKMFPLELLSQNFEQRMQMHQQIQTLLTLSPNNPGKVTKNPFFFHGQLPNDRFFLVPFMIDPKTGIVNVSRVLDISESEHYSLPVEVTDGLWKATVSFHTFEILLSPSHFFSFHEWSLSHGIIVTLSCCCNYPDPYWHCFSTLSLHVVHRQHWRYSSVKLKNEILDSINFGTDSLFPKTRLVSWSVE